MPFTAAFSAHLSAIMEAVVAQVTALVEDEALELRLELQSRDREILEKQRDIELRDREILKLRAAMEELRGREEEEEAAEEMPAEEEGQSSSQVWTKEEDPEERVVKPEPEEESISDEVEWPQSPLSSDAASANANTTANAFNDNSDSAHEAAQNYHAYYLEQAAVGFGPGDGEDLPLDSLLDDYQTRFHSRKPPFSQDSSASAGDLRCDQCGKTFTAKKRLRTHQSVHTGAKPFSCNICYKTFSRQDNCLRHKKLCISRRKTSDFSNPQSDE
ncbi:unnamed protein product [Knipowitschia caucasica]|uniref:C2H2-type domain-containing protein n=1 Tax=Knipowitschia caucasica TaxID=637954 RepID=A0AAV2JNK9_KNICA